MKKFWIVFKYEFMRQIKNKAFIIITSLFLVASVAGGFILSNKVVEITDPTDSEEVVEVDKETLYVFAQDDLKDYIMQLNALEMFEVEFVETEDDVQKMSEEHNSIGLIVEDYNHVRKIVTGTSLMKDLGFIDNTLNQMYQNKLLMDEGLTMDQIVNIQSARVNVELINIGADGIIGYAYTYAFSFLLYMTITIFGGIISSSVVTEKTSKAMELLITSADATSLIAGKVFAIGLSCILQLVLVVTGFVTTSMVMLSGSEVMQMISSFDAFRLDLILLGLFLFIVGFFSILFLFAGLSSFATKPEDANVVMTPLILITMVVFMINITAMASDLINMGFMKVLSFVPIVSPFLLFSRYALYGLTNFEIILGVVTNLLGGALLIWMAAKIYRSGTLHYGNTVSFRKIIKSFKK